MLYALYRVVSKIIAGIDLRSQLPQERPALMQQRTAFARPIIALASPGLRRIGYLRRQDEIFQVVPCIIERLRLAKRQFDAQF